MFCYQSWAKALLTNMAAQPFHAPTTTNQSHSKMFSACQPPVPHFSPPNIVGTLQNIYICIYICIIFFLFLFIFVHDDLRAERSRVNFLPICHDPCIEFSSVDVLLSSPTHIQTYTTSSPHWKPKFLALDVLLVGEMSYFNGSIYFSLSIQAQAALMHDAVLVLVETFNKLLWKKPDMFKTNTKRTLSNGNSSMSSISSSQILGLDCNSGRTSGNQWEHGEKISRFLRKVRITG